MVVKTSFNTWAREEPNPQLRSHLNHRVRFNTWAREEPNLMLKGFDSGDDVSILGLARSPTSGRKPAWDLEEVSILGLARSPTVDDVYYHLLTFCFNTWAREEPNAEVKISPNTAARFNTWAREEPNPIWAR